MLKVPQIAFEERHLENGLHVVLHRDDRVPLVHLSLHYRVGSSYERPGQSGLAHLFEHMMFQGSENVRKNEHFRHIDHAGGRCNASTSKDRTIYFETVPSHYLDLALWLESDRMRSLQINRENFENQRQTVIEEKKQSYDNRPYGQATLRFDQLAYENWAYAHPIIGEIEDLEKFTLKQASQFHQTYYGPNNAVLVLSGDLDGEATFERVAKYFEDIPAPPRPEPPDLNEPLQESAKEEQLRDPLAPLPGVYLGYHMPQLGSSEYYALSVLGQILSQGESSRFYRRFLFENNWMSDFSLGPNQYRGPGLFYIWFQVQDRVEPERVRQAVEAELSKLREIEVSQEELEKARNQISYHFVSRLAKFSRIGELLAHYTLFFEEPQRINRDLSLYLSVTAEDILRAASRCFVSENQTCIMVNPGKG